MVSFAIAAVLFFVEILHFIDCKICNLRPISIVDTSLVDANVTDSTNASLPLEWEMSTPPADYVCPRPGDASTYTECCVDGVGMPQCCALFTATDVVERRFYEIDNTLAMIIAASVISCCIVVAILVIVCCFWSHCPLYNTCRVQYESEVLTFDKEPDTIGLNNMPAEPNNQNKHQIYAHNNLSSGAAAAV